MLSGIDDHRWLIRSLLAIWVISSVFGAFMLYQLNGIVHGTLYDYGLQFSNGWAVPYWSFERVLYVYLLVPSFFGGLILALDLWKSRPERGPIAKGVENKVATKVTPFVQTATRDNSMMINCPKCDRIFSRPMSMLDFSTGKAQLVNVCPYCNKVLGEIEHDDVEVGVIEPDEEEVVKRR